jgi:hypothetical protein
MVELIVTSEQAELLLSAETGAVIRGPDGKCLGFVTRDGRAVVAEEAVIIEKWKQRRDSPDAKYYTTAEVFELLHALGAE